MNDTRVEYIFESLDIYLDDILISIINSKIKIAGLEDKN